MRYWTVNEAADAWGLSANRVRALCGAKPRRIEGLRRRQGRWQIPAGAPKPALLKRGFPPRRKE